MREQTRSEAQHSAQHTVMCAVQVCRDGGDDDDGGRGSGSSGGEWGVEAGQVMAEAVIRESHGQILGSSASYCEEPLSHLPGTETESLSPEKWGKLRSSVLHFVPYGSPGFRDRGEERDPRAGLGTTSLCHFARDAVTSAFPHHEVSASNVKLFSTLQGAGSPPHHECHGTRVSCPMSGFPTHCALIPAQAPPSETDDRRQAEQCQCPCPTKISLLSYNEAVGRAGERVLGCFSRDLSF